MQLTRLYVKNFGPIKEANIELGDLTIITGAQNSGKSYLATLIYALIESNSVFLVGNLLEKIEKILGFLFETEVVNLFSNINNVNEMIKKIEDNERMIVDLFNRSKYSEDIDKALIDRLARLLGLDARDVIRQGSTNMIINADYDKDYRQEYQIKKGKKDVISRLYINNTNIIKYIISVAHDIARKKDINIIKYIISVAYDIARKKDIKSELRIVVDSLFYFMLSDVKLPSVIYIPVERIFILTGLTHIINITLQYLQTLKPDLVPKSTLLSYLQALNLSLLRERIKNETHKTGSISYPIPSLGDLVIEYYEDSSIRISFYDKKRDVKIPLQASATGIAQLAGMIIPIERLSSDFIVIEEPEVNLHADMHIVVADYLADKVAEGKKIVITTHSEYLLARLAQLYAKGKIKDMKAYYIDRDNKVRKLEIDREKGEIELPEGIRDAIDTLAKDALKLIKV
ncbi:MAG: AAA family ATPase [Candidatus Nitrosocaldus sp.]